MSAVRLWRDDMGPVRDPCWYVQAAGGTTEWVALPAAEFEALVARARSSGCSECRRGECSCEEYAVERERDEARALLAQRSEQHAALVALLGEARHEIGSLHSLGHVFQNPGLPARIDAALAGLGSDK